MAAVAALSAPLAAAGPAWAEVPVQRTRFELPSSNGLGAVMLDLGQARLTHFREHLFATEEPRLEAAGNEVWIGNQPQSVPTRDLLYGAYFGLRSGGTQRWLTTMPVDLDASGYAPHAAGATGGTGIATMVQRVGDLEATQYFFAPRGLTRGGFVMAMRVRNTGSAPEAGVSAFSLHDFHLGSGRPGVRADKLGQHVGENGESVVYDEANGRRDFLERAFAGVIAARALEPVALTHHGASNNATPDAQHVHQVVNSGGAADLPDFSGSSQPDEGWVSAYQWDLGDIGPGEERWVGVAFAHHPDPLAEGAAQAALDAYLGSNQGADEVVAAETAEWASFQASLQVPTAATPEEETLIRHSAAVLRMAQVRESEYHLRALLTDDSTPRYTRFGTSPGGEPATLPATITHRGHGGILASLPPGEWTVSWIRDGSYATTAMALLGMADEAKDSLNFYLNAEANRFQTWEELSGYNMPPYQISLVRYHGFGVEETDFNEFGPNLEFDGFGLFLWALRNYEVLTGDTSVADDHWETVSTRVADVLVALVDPATGLIRPDSSIWEWHWNGRQRTAAYTSITAARGLCDAAAIAERRGDTARAEVYREAGIALRQAIANRLGDASGAVASTAEELAAGEGYFDAAVIEAVAMGLFDPQGNLAKATVAALDANLAVPAGAGWSRNDDFKDHAGAADLSPWGSNYDSAEWVVTDLRGAVAAQLMGDTQRSDRLVKWVLDQSQANYLAVAETYDENTGVYKFNSPMVGFGAGVFALAVAARDGIGVSPACG